MGFVNALAWVANREDHHPDLAVSYGRCTVRFNTHDVDGISVSDFFCAAAVNALLWVTLGNIAGGAGGVALAYRYAYLGGKKS